MSTELGKLDLAQKIQESQHAGEAKRQSKEIADDETRLKWEMENKQIMTDLLKAKSEQCQQFRDALIESKEKILAEATPSKLWATGLSPFITHNCSPSYWLGQNLLGAMLMDLRQELLEKNTNVADSMEQTTSLAPHALNLPEEAIGSSIAERIVAEAIVHNASIPESANPVTEATVHYDTLSESISVSESASVSESVSVSVSESSMHKPSTHKPEPKNDLIIEPIEPIEKKDITNVPDAEPNPGKQTVCSKHDQHVSRSHGRNLNTFRTPRAGSMRDRSSRSGSFEGSQQSLKGKKGNVGKGLNEKVTTPHHQDIRKAFEVKWKEMETSPENPNDSKSLRQDDT